MDNTCTHCGSTVAGDRVLRDFQGFCPGCLAREAGLEFPERKEGDLFSLGRYRAVRPLGRGGMGSVYEAVDDQTGRTVALKVLSTSLGDSPGEEARFLEEARLCSAAGRHPNLVAVYDAGVQDGRRFIAMERVSGVPLSEWARRPGVTLADRVTAVRDVLGAVAHIHERGIIHRDLKPSNVLVDESGVARLVDFGISRDSAREGNDRLTQVGQFIGTPTYMSPEQGKGRIDCRTDLYSAGAILYELISGKPPHEGDSPMELLLKAATEAPAPPSKAGGTGDPELDRICLKALARDPDARYSEASAFAEDLSKWLKGARRGSSSARALALLATAAAVILGAFLILRPERGEDTDPPPTLKPASVPSEETQTLRGHRGQVVRVAFSPEGGTLASSGTDGMVRLWSMPEGRLLHSLTRHGAGWVRGLAWTSKGDLVASSGRRDRRIRLWNPRTGAEIRAFAQPRDKAAGSLAFGPAGAVLASSSEGEGMIHLWDVARGELQRSLEGHQQLLLGLAFARQGNVLVSGSLDHTIRVWDVASGNEMWSRRPGCQWAGDSVAFSPDGRWVASEGEDGVLVLWDAMTGEPGRRFPGHTKHISSAAFSPDGAWIATGSNDTTIRIWSVATGTSLHVLKGHRGWVRSVDVSPDGLRLASGGTDGTVRLWEVPAPAPVD